MYQINIEGKIGNIISLETFHEREQCLVLVCIEMYGNDYLMCVKYTVEDLFSIDFSKQD